MVYKIATALSSIRQVCGNFVLHHQLPELIWLLKEIVPIASVLPVTDFTVPEPVPSRLSRNARTYSGLLSHASSARLLTSSMKAGNSSSCIMIANIVSRERSMPITSTGKALFQLREPLFSLTTRRAPSVPQMA